MIPELLSQYGYSGFLVLGAVSIVVITVLRRRHYGFTLLQAACFPVLLVMCGVLGAKILAFIKSGFSSFNGMAFFGAVFLFPVAMPFVGKLFRMTPGQTMDVSAPCVAIFMAFFRLGCLCAGCCGGITCTIGSVSFQWPTQLMESVSNISIFALLLYLEQREKTKGLLYPYFLIFYGVTRFFIEFLRSMPKDIMGMSEGQLNSLIATTIGAVWLIVSWQNVKKATNILKQHRN